MVLNSFFHSLQRTMCVRAVERCTNQGKDVTTTTLLYTVARRNMLVMTVENCSEDPMLSKFTCSFTPANSHSRYWKYKHNIFSIKLENINQLFTKNICFSATPVMLGLRKRGTCRITLRRHIHSCLPMEENPSKTYMIWQPIYFLIILHLKLFETFVICKH